MEHKLQEVVDFKNGIELSVMARADGKVADFWQLKDMFFQSLDDLECYLAGITPEMMKDTTRYNLLCAYPRRWYVG